MSRDYTAGLQFDAYLANTEKLDSVERRLITIGEALNQLDSVAPDLAEKIPNLREAVGMRNQLTHVYHDVEQIIVWDTAVKDVPEMRRTVDTLLSELSPPSPSEERGSSPQPAAKPEPPKTNDDDLLSWQKPPSPFD